MGVRINPCCGCPLKDGCTLREEWRNKVRGLGLRNCWFACPTLTKEIRPGRRIQVSVPVSTGDGWDDCQVSHRQVSATITSADRKAHTFACVIDPGQIHEDDLLSAAASETSVRFLKRRHHWRIVRFLDEPDAEICPGGNVRKGEACDSKDGHCPCKEMADAARAWSEA